MPWKLYSHILDILSFPVCFLISHFCILLLSSLLKSSPGDQRLLTLRQHQRPTHTHTVSAHKACVAMKNARGGDSQKTHNSPLPHKSGSESVVVWGGSVMVLMWEAGWVNIPDGRGTDNDEGRTREGSRNQRVTRNQKISTTSFLNTHTHTQRDAHLSQISVWTISLP